MLSARWPERTVGEPVDHAIQATPAPSVSGPPFAPGSISLRLYPHNDLAPSEVLSEICAQASAALRHGFDGIMTSEHHGGFAGYLPNPLQVATFILEENDEGWAAACPLLLPLRPTALVAEEVAWLAARHPGRVGLGVAAGALPLDFEAMDVPLGSAVDRFKSELPRLVDMLGGRDLRELGNDPALSAGREHPVPVLSAAASVTAARRAAHSGAGLLLEGMSSVDRLRRICDGYDDAKGTGTKVLIRRVWVGAPDPALVAAQREVYESYSGPAAAFGDDQTISAESPGELATGLHAAWRASGADALNLRIHLPGLPPDAVRRQIDLLGAEVLPALRELIPA
ncbi:MAG TPA: LLM class flavin-dependent oxidoreductase [Acidimicrobiales bacterium]|jgi:alkanesulfonate monooxygenase SsuD/methylene tetrahydromethanopterin reductase-like flavin-dependent oxidoreductase (luciferase family)